MHIIISFTAVLYVVTETTVSVTISVQHIVLFLAACAINLFVYFLYYYAMHVQNLSGGPLCPLII